MDVMDGRAWRIRGLVPGTGQGTRALFGYTPCARARRRVATANPREGLNESAPRKSLVAGRDEGEPTVRIFINGTGVGDHPSGAISFHQPLISPLRVAQHLVTPGGTLVAPQEVLMKTNLTQNGGRTYFLLRLLVSPSVPLPSHRSPSPPRESIWSRPLFTFSCAPR